MTGAQSPESIGEAFAADAWDCSGRGLVTRPQSYARAVEKLEKRCADPAARRAFDRHLAQLAVDDRVIVRPKLPLQSKARRRRS